MLWAVESSRRVSDEMHVEAAAREKRIILTEDSDFSGLVAGKAKTGDPLPAALYYFRLDGLGRAAKLARMIEAIDEIGAVAESFTIHVVEPSRIRPHQLDE